MKSVSILFCLSIFLYGCVNPIEKQADNLLPESNVLELVSEREIGITNFYTYKVTGDLNPEKLLKFPINVISEKEKAVIKWHKPDENELRDIKVFIEEEQENNKTATQLLESLLNGRKYLIALIYDKDRKPLGTQGYSVYDWMELYFLNTKEKELIHISYGKF
jgi:hypothetical protein